MEFLIDNPLLTLCVTIALGAAFGLVRFGPVRLGAAGALFVGLFIGAFDTEEQIGSSLSLVKTLGLGLFVYMVGLAAGRGLVRSLRTQFQVMVVSLVILTVVAVAGWAMGSALDMAGTYQGGAYSGVGTSTGALGAAQAAAVSAATEAEQGNTWSGEVAVGYSIAYPIGVIIGILMVFVANRRLVPSTPRDPEQPVGGLVDLTILVKRPALLSEVPGAAAGTVRFSYLSRATDQPGTVGIAMATDQVAAGDRVVVIGRPEAVDCGCGAPR